MNEQEKKEIEKAAYRKGYVRGVISVAVIWLFQNFLNWLVHTF